jgi:hypothetical protein
MSVRDGLRALLDSTRETPLLADSSVWGWHGRLTAELRAAFDDAVLRGGVGCCDQIRLELLYSARDSAELARLRADLASLPDAPIGKEVWRRAIDVYAALAEAGPLHHRRVKQPDLLIAAAAEAVGWPLLHYDRDFDVIGTITAQPCIAVARVGTL